MPYFDDKGNILNPDLIPIPSLCICCIFNNDPDAEILCNLNRLAQRDQLNFECDAYDTFQI